MSKQYDYIVYVGRFQPPHKAHIETIEEAAEKAQNVIVLIGSANQPRTSKNPWTWRERAEMIQACVNQQTKSVLYTFPLRDKLYNDQQWAGQVQEAVDSIIRMSPVVPENARIGIIGYSKDESTYYLKLFPQWDLIDIGSIEDLNATDIRNAYFEEESEQQFDQRVGSGLPIGIRDALRAFSLRAEYNNLVDEHTFIEQYKQAWSVAPYPPTFVTTDAVVIQSGHVLLVRRRAAPGKNTIALPGGFLAQNERIIDGMIRELREETKIKVPAPVLKGNITKQNVFDHPDRSLRGRTISHASCIELPPGPLPKVKGGDDAAKAFWIPLSTFGKMEDQMFEDHWHIINYFIGEL